MKSAIAIFGSIFENLGYFWLQPIGHTVNEAGLFSNCSIRLI